METAIKLPTSNELYKHFLENVDKAIEYAESFNLEYPNKPAKPFLNKEHNSATVKQYQKDYEQYEIDLVEYGKQKALYNERNSEINHLIEEYIKNLSGYNDLPEKAKSKVWHKAWEDGHSNGYYQVYYELKELVDLFN